MWSPDITWIVRYAPFIVTGKRIICPFLILAVDTLVPVADHGVSVIPADNPTGFCISIRNYVYVLIAKQGTGISYVSFSKLHSWHEE